MIKLSSNRNSFKACAWQIASGSCLIRLQWQSRISKLGIDPKDTGRYSRWLFSIYSSLRFCSLLMHSGRWVSLAPSSWPMYNFSKDAKERISFGNEENWFPVSPRIFSFESEPKSEGNWHILLSSRAKTSRFFSEQICNGQCSRKFWLRSRNCRLTRRWKERRSQLTQFYNKYDWV